MASKFLCAAILLTGFGFANETSSTKIILPKHANNPYFEADVLCSTAKQEGNDIVLVC